MSRLDDLWTKARGFMFPGTSSNTWATVGAADYIPIRRQASGGGAVAVTAESALRHSAVWACLRLRANLISSTPIDVYRRLPDGTQVEVAKPPLLVSPGGARPAYQAGSANSVLSEWLWSTQFDLDRYGNVFGIITARDGMGLPSVVELLPTSDVTVLGRGQQVTKVRVGRDTYDPAEIWHERQYTVPGFPVGLSPIMYAAWSIGGYLSAQKFGLEYFEKGGNPTGHLRRTQGQVDDKQIAEAKSRWKVAVEGRDIFVSGADWEWNPAAAPEAAAAFLEEMKYGVGDVARFLDVPGDMIDAESSTGSITYANITQRNLQLLITSMGPAYHRREQTFTAATPSPRYVRFNTDAILRMDPETRAKLLVAQVAGRTLAPSEAREIDNRPPFTPEQLAEFAALFPAKQQSPAPAAASAWEVPA